MSKAGRSIAEDRAATRDVILGVRPQHDGEVNWLGHRVGSANARMDDMLVRGATREELATSGRDPDNQLYHLRKDHGLEITLDAERHLRFDRAHLGIDTAPVPAISEIDAPFGTAAANQEVERAAVSLVTARLRTEGWHVQSVERDGCGFDLHCLRDREELHVEVKGLRGEGTRFVLTEGEFRRARDDPRFVLFLVSHALEGNPTVEIFPGSDLLAAFALTPLQYVARRSAT